MPTPPATPQTALNATPHATAKALPILPPRSAAAEDADGSAGLWFESGDDGRVCSVSPSALRLGVETGMATPQACVLLAPLVEGLAWKATEAGLWRCAPTCPAGSRSAAERLQDARGKLQEEVRRRRYLERLLLSATENERRRISLELHDGLGQHLSGLAFTARSIASQLRDQAQSQAGEADWLARLLHDAVGRVRAMSRGLWPVSLERQSLPQALQALGSDIEALYGITVQVSADGFEAESAPAAHHLFRIAQEAIHNALRHGQARHIELRLERVPPAHMLSITSDGAVLDRKAASAGQGLGLIGMQLRADALGGDLSVEPLAGGGVEVCLLWTPTPRARNRVADATRPA